VLLRVQRFPSADDFTLGGLSIDRRFCCFTLEDERREVKVPGETRIPAGAYVLKLRAEGTVHDKYKGKFAEHRGMIWLQDVPGFEWIYIHVGNTDEHTAGCILVGDSAQAHGELGASIPAYRRLYGQVANAILAGEPVTITVED
jgi:uncharacterized protein DUF5675